MLNFNDFIAVASGGNNLFLVYLFNLAKGPQLLLSLHEMNAAWFGYLIWHLYYDNIAYLLELYFYLLHYPLLRLQIMELFETISICNMSVKYLPRADRPTVNNLFSPLHILEELRKWLRKIYLILGLSFRWALR